jgi:Kef-type K+ transport system membrane component KefB
MRNESAFEMAGGISILLVATFVGALILHFGLRLPWGVLGIPIAAFAAVQVAFLPAMSLSLRDRSMRARKAILVSYVLASLLIVAYYGVRWGLIPGREDRGVWVLPILVALVAGAGSLLMPRRWRKWISELPGAVDCARCGHLHEFRDCKCGCKANQFRYRVVGI